MIGRLHPHAITAERPDEGDDAELVERLVAIVRGAPSLMRVLLTIRALELPDWLVMSGAVYQRVLNALTERVPDYGVRDYDLGYFDASDISYEAEDAVIRRAAAAFDEPLRSAVEVRNQARVHVWFEGHFGELYTPLSCTAEALERFLSPMFAVGVRLKRDHRLHIAAPFGLADLFALRLRPNPRRFSANFFQVAAGVTRRWPEVTVEGAQPRKVHRRHVINLIERIFPAVVAVDTRLSQDTVRRPIIAAAAARPVLPSSTRQWGAGCSMYSLERSFPRQ